MMAQHGRQASHVSPTPGAIDPRRIAAEYMSLMDALLAVVEEETQVVRSGRLAEAAKLGERKAELSGRYLNATVQLKANAAAWFAGDVQTRDRLRERSESFRPLLQKNLAVLATAHAVAEGVIRGAVGEHARKSGPQGYGARGAATAAPRSAQPVVLSRSL